MPYSIDGLGRGAVISDPCEWVFGLKYADSYLALLRWSVLPFRHSVGGHPANRDHQFSGYRESSAEKEVWPAAL